MTRLQAPPTGAGVVLATSAPDLLVSAGLHVEEEVRGATRELDGPVADAVTRTVQEAPADASTYAGPGAR